MIAKAENVSETKYEKFMFDTDFDDLPSYNEMEDGAPLISPAVKATPEEDAEAEPEQEAEPEPEVPTFSEEDLARAREQGVAEGREQGIAEAAEATEKQIGDGLETLIKHVGELFETQAQANHELTTNAISVAAALVRKLFPTLNEQTALDQVEAMLRNALEQLGGTPEIAVRVPTDLAEAVHDRIEAFTALTGLQGELKVIGDADLAVGDCRLEWARGGVARSTEELAQDLDEIIDRNLTNPAAPEEAVTDEAQDNGSTAAGEDTVSSEVTDQPVNDLQATEVETETIPQAPAQEQDDVAASPEPALEPDATGNADLEAGPDSNAPPSAPIPSQDEAAPESAEIEAAPVPSELDTAPVPSQDEAAPVPSESEAAPVPSEIETAPADAEAEGAPVPSRELEQETPAQQAEDVDTDAVWDQLAAGDGGDENAGPSDTTDDNDTNEGEK